MSIDVIIFAVIAAFLVHRLRAILGTRHGDEPPRVNPYVAPSEDPQAVAPPKQKPSERDWNPAPGVVPQPPMLDAHPETMAATPLQMRLFEIAAEDRQFDPAGFIFGAGEAYKMIVRAFAAGEREVLRPLLATDLFADFDRVIAEREKQNQKGEAEIRHIKHAEITDAKVEKGMAFITVEFTAETRNVIRDEAGNIISGSVDETEDTIDIWTFSRKLRARDPNWILVATRAI